MEAKLHQTHSTRSCIPAGPGTRHPESKCPSETARSDWRWCRPRNQYPARVHLVESAPQAFRQARGCAAEIRKHGASARSRRVARRPAGMSAEGQPLFQIVVPDECPAADPQHAEEKGTE